MVVAPLGSVHGVPTGRQAGAESVIARTRRHNQMAPPNTCTSNRLESDLRPPANRFSAQRVQAWTLTRAMRALRVRSCPCCADPSPPAAPGCACKPTTSVSLPAAGSGAADRYRNFHLTACRSRPHCCRNGHASRGYPYATSRRQALGPVAVANISIPGGLSNHGNQRFLGD
jgi:hypothetical protein